MSTSAHAYLVLELKDVTNNVSKICNNQTVAGVAACTLAGFTTTLGGNDISFAGSVGSFTTSNSFSTTNNPGTATEATLDQTANRVKYNGPGVGQFYIDLTAYGFSLPAGPLRTLFGSSGESTAIVNAAGQSVSNEFYADGTDSGLKSNGIFCSYNVTTNNSCAAPGTTWLGGPLFSLREVQLFTLASGQDVNTTANLTVTVPEPVSTSLVGAGLIALALSSRRRQSKQA